MFYGLFFQALLEFGNLFLDGCFVICCAKTRHECWWHSGEHLPVWYSLICPTVICLISSVVRFTSYSRSMRCCISTARMDSMPTSPSVRLSGSELMSMPIPCQMWFFALAPPAEREKVSDARKRERAS